MNRRSFLRSVLLSAAALALPWKGKAAESEPVVSAELADSVDDVFNALDDFDIDTSYAREYCAQMRAMADRIIPWLQEEMEHQSCRYTYVGLDTDGDHPYYLRLRDEA